MCAKDVSIDDKIGWWHNCEKLWKERFVLGFFSGENTIFTTWKYLRSQQKTNLRKVNYRSFLAAFYTIDNCTKLFSDPLNIFSYDFFLWYQINKIVAKCQSLPLYFIGRWHFHSKFKTTNSKSNHCTAATFLEITIQSNNFLYHPNYLLQICRNWKQQERKLNSKYL